MLTKILYAALILLGAYIIFIPLPSLVCFLLLFAHTQRSRSIEENVDAGSYLAPYADTLLPAARRVRALDWRRVGTGGCGDTPLRASYLPGEGDKVALLLHGYRADPVANFCTQIEFLRSLGFGILLADERAHGESGGRFTGLGLLESEDILSWLEWIESESPGARVLVYGMSMGCSAAAYVSDRLPPDRVRAMVLDCGFTEPCLQLERECRRRRLPTGLMMPWVRLFGRIFIGRDLREDTARILARTKIPALFFHGEADRTVPVSQGRENYEACASKKDCLFLPGAEHTLTFPAGGDAAREKLLALINDNF